MSTTTGNVKISALPLRNEISNDGREVFPISFNSDAASTSYESFKVSAATLADYTGRKLAITTTGGLNDKVAKLITDLTDTNDRILEYDEAFGNYKDLSPVDMTVLKNGYYYTEAGVEKENSAFAYSNRIKLKAGTIYILDVTGAQIPDDIAFFVKQYEHKYHPFTGWIEEDRVDPITGETHKQLVPTYGPETTEYFYEPISSHYHVNQYGVPATGHIVFICTEDEDMIFCAPASNFSTRLQSAHMGIVSEIADEFISNDGELAKVLVEAIESNRKNIETLNSKIDNLGDAHAIGMDSDKMYTHRGAAMIIESSIAPTSAPDRHPYQPSKVPSFVGQIWVQTGTENAWLATGVNTVGDWRKINLV